MVSPAPTCREILFTLVWLVVPVPILVMMWFTLPGLSVLAVVTVVLISVLSLLLDRCVGRQVLTMLILKCLWLVRLAWFVVLHRATELWCRPSTPLSMVSIRVLLSSMCLLILCRPTVVPIRWTILRCGPLLFPTVVPTLLARCRPRSTLICLGDPGKV